MSAAPRRRRTTAALLAAATTALATAAAAPATARAAAQVDLVPVDGSPRTVLARAGGEGTELAQLGWTADGASLTYVRDHRMGWYPVQILRQPVGGGPAARLRSLPADRTVAVSPDVRHVAEAAYVTRRGEVRPIVVRDVATGAVRARIRPLRRPESGPIVMVDAEPFCWSPDGRHLAVTERGDERSGEQITRVFAAATGRLVRTARDGLYTAAAEACFTPDGRLTLSAGVSVDVAARAVDLATGRTTSVPTHGRPVEGPLAWSPDGARLAYGSGDGLAVVDALTGLGPVLPVDPHGLPNTAAANGLGLLAWSPDGRTLAFSYATRDGLDGEPAARGPSLSVMPADGSAPPRVLVRASARSTITGMAWSPDGTRIALATARPDRRPAR